MSSYTTIDWEKGQNLKLKTEKCEYEVILGVFNRKNFIFNFKLKSPDF
jgi:hypothetical protein